MDTQELQIRAKKISQLNDYNLDIDQNKDNSYIIIGYNKGTHKENFRMSLRNFLTIIDQNSTFINDDILVDKINSFITQKRISIDSLNGPQGPQGPQGAGINPSDIDLTDIQNQIDDLYRRIGIYHTAYTISYNLTNITPSISNPTHIEHGDFVTLYFSPNTGYKLPNSISVSGCESTYNKSNSSITISNPTSNVNIIMRGEKNQYSLSYSFNHINYEVTNNDKEYYTIDEIVNLTLTPSEGYVLPSSLVNTNCDITYIQNNDGTAQLTVICKGLGNMLISGTALSSASYYFGYILTNDTSSISIENEYYPNGEFKGLQNVNVLSTTNLTLSNSCPFNNGSLLKINGVGLNNDIILFIHNKFFNANSNEFIDDSNNTYKLYPKGFAISPITFPYKCQTRINGMQYWALLIPNQYDGAEYVFTKN